MTDARYSLSHLNNGALLASLRVLVGKESAATAEVIAHFADGDVDRWASGWLWFYQLDPDPGRTILVVKAEPIWANWAQIRLR